MGCGVSTQVLDDDAPPPAGLSPIRRRIEEIKRRNRRVHKRSKSRLSSKELLHDQSVVDDEDEEYYNDGCSPKSGVSCRLESIEEVENQGTPKHNHLVDKEEVMNESSTPASAPAPAPLPPPPPPPPPAAASENVVVYNNVNVVVYGKNVNVVAEKKIEEKQHHVQEEKQNHVQDEKPHHIREEKQHHVQEEKQDVEKAEKEEKEEQDQEEIIDGLEDGYGSDFFPGSPSFREYCVFSADKGDDDDEEDEEEEVCKDGSNGDGEKREEMTQRDESTEPNEGSVAVLVKKGHKGRKFKRILPKGGQAAVKNLMNVKSCYIPPCSNFQNRHTRLPPHTSA